MYIPYGEIYRVSYSYWYTKIGENTSLFESKSLGKDQNRKIGTQAFSCVSNASIGYKMTYSQSLFLWIVILLKIGVIAKHMIMVNNRLKYVSVIH